MIMNWNFVGLTSIKVSLNNNIVFSAYFFIALIKRFTDLHPKRDHLCCIFHVQVQNIQNRTSDKLEKPGTENGKSFIFVIA